MRNADIACFGVKSASPQNAASPHRAGAQAHGSYNKIETLVTAGSVYETDTLLRFCAVCFVYVLGSCRESDPKHQ